MLALQRGLVTPEWISQPERDSRRRTWLWLAVGLPVFIAGALAFGTFMLMDGASRSGRDFTGIVITIWVVGGVVGLAAVTLGSIGLMISQREPPRRAPRVEVPLVEPAPPPAFDDRDAGTERIWKQEKP